LSNRDDWQTVTIEQIAQTAEIGKGTVSKHFPSKDDIYARLAINFHRLVLQRIRAIDPSLPATDKLREIVRVFWDVYSAHTEYQRVVDYCRRPDFQRLLSDENRRAMQMVDSRFTEAIHNNRQRGSSAGRAA
jgi:AcrR family transcriptional regulator